MKELIPIVLQVSIMMYDINLWLHFNYIVGKSSVSKHPQENQVIGAKSSADGCFYRAMVIQKFDEENYVLSFIDYGFEETVHVADIVYLPIELQEVNFD